MKTLLQPRTIGLLLLFLVLAWLLLGQPALAGQAVLTWNHPTTRTDGSALPGTAIGKTFIEWGACSGTSFGTLIGSLDVAYPASTATLNALSPGVVCFRLYTVTTTGLSSGPSAVVSKVIPAPPEVPPAPPTIVTISTQAWVLKNNWWGLGSRLVSVRAPKFERGIVCGAPVEKHRGYYYVSGQYIGRCRVSG